MAILIDHIQNVIQSDGVPNLILGLSGTVVTINGDPVSTSTFNTGTLVLQAVSAGYATTASLASYATTSSIATSAAYATTSSLAAYATTSSIATSAAYATTSSLAAYATTASLASYATTSSIASTATSAAIAYSLASTSTTQVGFAVNAFTATNAAVAYSLASTSTTQVGFAVNAFTATNSFFASTASFAAVAYSLVGSGSLTVGSATTATNIAGGQTGWIHIQSTTGTTSFINIGSAGNLLQSNGSTATFVSTTTLQVGNALSAVNASYATTASLASYATTASLASYATTSSIATSAAYATTSSLAAYATTSSIATSAAYATTSSLASYATTSSIASTATSAAVAYSIVNTSTLQVGFAVNAFTATSAAIAYAVASTSTLQVGSALFAVTATSAAVAYSLASTSTTQVGFAVNAFTATSAATAYSWTGGTVPNAVTFSGPVTFSGTATYILSTNTVYTDNIIEMHTTATGVSGTWTYDDGKDIGFRFHYYGAGADQNAALVMANDTKYLEWYGTGAENNSGTFIAASYGTIKTGSISLTGVITATTFFGNLTGTASTATAAATAYALANTATYQVGYAVNAFTATSAATAYSLANTGTTQVGSAVNSVYAVTATNIAGGLTGWIHIQSTTGTTSFINIGSNGNLLQSNGSTATFVSTSTLQVGFAVNAFTATSAATAYTLANTSTFQVGFAGSSYSATTATSAATAYALANTSTTQVGFAVNAFTATSAAIAYSVASTSSLQVGSAVNAVFAVTATNIAGGQTGWIHIQSTTGTTSFINIGSAGNLLQSNGSTATFVSTTTLQVGNAVLAVSAGYATTSSLASYATTASLASYATTASLASYATTSSIASTATSAAVAYSLVNTSTFQVGFAVNAFTATNAALAYAVASTSTLQVGSALFAVTATSAAIAYSLASTSTTQVGFAVSAFTATSAATAYSLVNTSTAQVGFAVSAFTATSAATAYSLVNTSTAQVGFAVNAFTATSAATAYNLANTTTFLVGNALTSVNATNATNIAGGTAGMIHIQSAAGVTSFINTGTVGYVLQMQTGNTASWVSTSSLGISGGGGGTVGSPFAGIFTITNTTVSTSTTTGALQVTGGVGIGGRLYVGSSATFYVDPASGRVGIGTNSPFDPLTITNPNDGDAQASIYSLTTGTGTRATLNIRTIADGWWSMQTGNNVRSGLRFVDVGSGQLERMRIDATGTVYINTTTQYSGERFSVNGDAYINGVITSTNHVITGITASTSTTTGALTVAGGIGVGGDLNVGGKITATQVQSSIIGATTGSTLSIQSNGATYLTLDTVGNLGLGVTPASWFGGYYKVMQIGSSGALFSVAGGNNSTMFSSANLVVDSAGITKYQNTSFASYYAQQNGSHFWYAAPSGTAGTTATFTQSMSIDNSGVVKVVTTATSISTTTGALQVAGGVGIGGTLYVGALRADATSSATTFAVYYNAVTKELTTSTAATGGGGGLTSPYAGIFTITNTASVSSTNTGALQVAGGVGIGQDLWVGGNIYSGGAQLLPTSIQEFTATASQTIFTVSGGYTVGSVQVYANGVALGNSDIVASNGTTVTLTTPRAVGDIIRITAGLASPATNINSLKAFSVAMSVALG